MTITPKLSRSWTVGADGYSLRFREEAGKLRLNIHYEGQTSHPDDQNQDVYLPDWALEAIVKQVREWSLQNTPSGFA